MFEWKPEYSVQIPDIDTQHQRLFALAGELHAALGEGKAKTVLDQCLDRLVDYTKIHFAAEEQLMAQYKYPEAAAHKIEHDKLAGQVINLQERFRGGGKTVSFSLMVFLKNWLEQHIACSDQKYSAYIRARRAA